MNKEETNLGTKLSYLIIGGGIGALLALLFAPKAGEAFRAEIADATRSGIAKTEDLASQFSEKAQTVYTDSKAKVGEIYDSTKQKIGSVANVMTKTPTNLKNTVHHKVEQISAVIEVGRKEYDREDRLQDGKPQGKTN